MKNRAMICRALSGHSWEIQGPIVVLKESARRITFYCARCECWRSDVWEQKGRVIQKRYYKYSSEYAAFIKEHNRAEAREALIGTLKEKASNETDNPRVRLAALKPRAASGRKPARAHKRPRDKRRAQR